MRFAASPLLVAVALGFLGPAALEGEDDDLEEFTSDASATHSAATHAAATHAAPSEVESGTSTHES